MPSLRLKTLLSSKSAGSLALVSLLEALGSNICILDSSGNLLLGDRAANSSNAFQAPVLVEDVTLGFVVGPPASANALASLLAHLAAGELERRALASEVLHLYREVHLIEQLSEQLAAVLNLVGCRRIRLGPGAAAHPCYTRQHPRS